MNVKINIHGFEPNRERCSKEFRSPKHEKFRLWYFKNHNKEQLMENKESYYDYLKCIGYEISFVQWYNLVKTKLNVSKENRTWDTINGKTITDKHPPLGGIKYGNIEATAYVPIDKKMNEETTIVVKQNNYTYLHLQTLAT